MGFGHEDRRLADAVASYSAAPVSRLIAEKDPVLVGATPARGDFSKMERGLIASIFSRYGDLPPPPRVAILTRGPGFAREKSYADSARLGYDIPHNEVRAQFLQLADYFSPGGDKP